MSIDSDDNVDQQAAEWFIRLRAENVNRNDKAAFNAWLEQDETNRAAFAEMCEIWDDPEFLQELLNSADQYEIAPKQPKQQLFNQHLSLAVAACFAFVAVFGNHLYLLAKADFSSAIGEHKTVILSDGSTVMLNTDSAIAVVMEKQQRRIELLKGEAYFDVTPDPLRPFIVSANYSTTRVLGTRFFVHQQQNNDQVKVLSGRVEVCNNLNRNEQVLLLDRDAVSVTEKTLGQPRRLDSGLSISWIDGVLEYENETLETVINHINRNFTGIIFFKDDSLRNLKINGRLKYRDAHEMLQILQKTLSIKITYLTDWVVIIG